MLSPVGTTPPAMHRYAAWEGRWDGVEGMYVVISSAEPSVYRLDMQSDLDTMGAYVGSESSEGIRFVRNDQVLLLRQGSGAETGLKYLADKKDCLVVKSGEGYCRD